MRNFYKVPKHIRAFVEQELYDYRRNKRLIVNFKGNTRDLIIKAQRIAEIEAMLERLSEEDKEAFNIIFWNRINQPKAEQMGYSKTAYYYAKNKIVYLTAEEMDMI